MGLSRIRVVKGIQGGDYETPILTKEIPKDRVVFH